MKSKETQAFITKIKSADNNLVKKFSLVKKKIIKESPKPLHTGKALRMKISLSDLKSIISGLKSTECLCLGVCDRKKQRITTQQKIQDGSAKKGAIARTTDNFIFQPGKSAFCLLDIDGVDKSPDQILKILNKIIPGFKKAGKLIVPSSSAGIRNKKTKELYKKQTSAHIFVQVADGSDIPRFMDAVFDSLVLAGHGRIEISAAPSMLKRSLIDRAVASPERLVFEALPKCAKGLVQDSRKLHFISGRVLDTSKTKTPDKKLVRNKWDQLITDNQQRLDTEINKKIRKLKKQRKISFSKASEIVEANRNYKLENDLMLYFSDGENMTVEDLLTKGKANRHYQTLADPLEPDYDGGNRSKAIFFWNNGQDPIIRSYAHGLTKYTFLQTEVDNANITQSVIDHFNKDHAHGYVGGKYRIIREIPDPITKAEKIELTLKDDFVSYNANYRVKSGEGTKPASTIWLNSNKSRKFETVTFDPKQEVPDNVYNLFKGLNFVQPIKGNLDPFLKFVENDVCGGRTDLFKWVMRWFQNIIREPWNKNRIALVLYSSQGCGKGFMINHFSKLFMPYYIHLQKSKQLTDTFNACLSGRLLVFADEAMITKKESADRMKGLITEDTILITHKGVNGYDEPSFMNIVIATNHNHAIFADRSDRRYTVIKLTENHMQDRVFFKKLNNFMINEGGLNALCYHLLKEDDYAGVDSRVHFDTDELREQKRNSMGSIKDFWSYILERGYILPSSRPSIMSNKNKKVFWEKDIRLEKHLIYEEYLLFCRKTNVPLPKSKRIFWNQTDSKKTNNPIFKKSCKKGNGNGNIAIFIPGSLKRMREEFNEHVIST